MVILPAMPPTASPVMRLRSPEFPSAMAVAQDRLPVTPPGAAPPVSDTAPPATLRSPPASLVDSPATREIAPAAPTSEPPAQMVTFPEFPLSAVPEVKQMLPVSPVLEVGVEISTTPPAPTVDAPLDAKCAASSCARAACHRKIASCIVGTGLYRNTASA